MSRRRRLRASAAVCGLAGAGALGWVGAVAIDARLYQDAGRAQLVRPKTSAEANAVPSVREGDAIAEIEIARVGLRAIVAQGESPAVLRRAVGHLPDTAMPGTAGHVVLAGHRDTVFRPLRHVRPGDRITLRTEAGFVRYDVESTSVVPPTDLRVLAPTAEPTLTLITCHPFGSVGPAPNRFIVRARASRDVESSAVVGGPR